jgi:hypothetical protein
MQDAGYGLPGTPLLHTWVNKGKRKGQVPTEPSPSRSLLQSYPHHPSDVLSR